MDSVNYGGNYMETELSDSIVLIEDLTDSNGDKVDQLCDSGKIYHSCYIHRRNNQPEDDDDDNDAGEAIALSINERGTPDGKSDTDVDEDIAQSGSRELVPITFEDEGDNEVEEDDDDDDDDDEEEEEEEEDEDEENKIQGEEEEDDDEDEDEDDDEDDDEEHIEVRTPQWTETRILTHSDTASADSGSTSECESKSTSVSFVDDSLLVTTSQQADGQVDSVGMTLTDYSDLEDKTDFSSFQELTNDNDETNDESGKDDKQQSKKVDIYGGPIDNKGFDTVDSQLIASNHQHHHRIFKGSTEETVGLLSAEIENEDKVNQIEDNPLIEINRKPLMYLENPLIGTGINDDQVSLITKHSTYQRHAIKLNDGTSNFCSASASSASTSSTSSRTIARRMVKSSGKAVKSFSKKITKLFK